MKPNREKIEAEDLVKERLPLTKWELTPKEKEDFDRVMRGCVHHCHRAASAW
jgi:hypothetical protein